MLYCEINDPQYHYNYLLLLQETTLHMRLMKYDCNRRNSILGLTCAAESEMPSNSVAQLDDVYQASFVP